MSLMSYMLGCPVNLCGERQLIRTSPTVLCVVIELSHSMSHTEPP